MRGKCKSGTLQSAKESVFRLLKIRLRSENEIRDKLGEKSFTKQVVGQAVAYFKDIGLIDDRQFTQKWVLSRLAKPFGVNRIRFELKEKGVADDLIEQVLEKAAKDFSELEVVTALAKHRAGKYPGLERVKVRQRVYAYLARRGFNGPVIIQAVKNI